jgi:hypothetical protein
MTTAERFLQSLGVTDPQEIDLEAIAWTQGVVVNYRPLDGGQHWLRGVGKPLPANEISPNFFNLSAAQGCKIGLV